MIVFLSNRVLSCVVEIQFQKVIVGQNRPKSATFNENCKTKDIYNINTNNSLLLNFTFSYDNILKFYFHHTTQYSTR